MRLLFSESQLVVHILILLVTSIEDREDHVDLHSACPELWCYELAGGPLPVFVQVGREINLDDIWCGNKQW